MGKYESELDYLAKSLDYVLGQRDNCLNKLREAKEAMASLKVDVEVITNPKLKDAALKTFNHFSMEKTKYTNLIKEIREDEKWIRVIIKICSKKVKHK